jgi:hypothetical protein
MSPWMSGANASSLLSASAAAYDRGAMTSPMSASRPNDNTMPAGSRCSPNGIDSAIMIAA